MLYTVFSTLNQFCHEIGRSTEKDYAESTGLMGITLYLSTREWDWGVAGLYLTLLYIFSYI